MQGNAMSWMPLNEGKYDEWSRIPGNQTTNLLSLRDEIIALLENGFDCDK
jgi:hypothetical protein